MRECWVIEEQNDNGEWYVIYSGGKVSAEEELASWPSTPENPKRLVRYVPADGLAALHQELDWMLSSLSATDTAELSASILLRWRNTLAQVIAPPQEDRES